MGLCESEWLPLLNLNLQRMGLVVPDFVQTAKQLSQELRAQVCEYIIALTHMGLTNDRVLAEKCQDDIDIVMGGHDHLSVFEQIGKVAVVKSGSDFEEFSDLTVNVDTKAVTRSRVIISEDYQPDQEIVNHVSEYSGHLKKKLEKVVGFVDVDLDSRFENIRTRETNFGNFMADLCLISAPEIDIVFIASGNMRAN